MSPGTLIASLHERGVSLSISKSGRLRVSPRTSLTPEESAYLRANAAPIATALLALDALDRAFLKDDSFSVPPSTKRVMFRTSRGLLLLAELNAAEVRRLASRGRITADEVRSWHSWQESRHRRAIPSWRFV